MKVELDRQTDNGLRTVHLSANDRVRSSAAINEWIAMLKIAERWLREKESEAQP